MPGTQIKGAGLKPAPTPPLFIRRLTALFYRFRDSTSSSRESLVVMTRELAWKARW